jgi:hypothetical protein
MDAHLKKSMPSGRARWTGWLVMVLFITALIAADVLAFDGRHLEAWHQNMKLILLVGPDAAVE